jgi:hypothetical protein
MSGNKDFHDGRTSEDYVCEPIVTSDSIDRMEYHLMCEGEECCDNGHWNDILDNYRSNVSMGMSMMTSSLC